MYVSANPLLAQKFQRTRPINDPHPALVQDVSSYPDVFKESSSVIVCARALGALLIERGVVSFNPNAYSDVMKRFGGTRAAEFAPQVAQSLNKDALYFIALGQELQWLSQVLPAAVRGDWGPYLSTGTLFRQTTRQQLIYFNQMDQIFGANPQNRAFLENAMAAFLSQIDPLIEQQIVVLAVTNLGG
jgi:hypothetical protein